MKDRTMSFSMLPTIDLVDRAVRAVSDPDLSPYSARTSAALKATLTALAETARRHGPPPGFDTLRELSLSILVDFDEAEQQREAAGKVLAELAELRRRATVVAIEAARGVKVGA